MQTLRFGRKLNLPWTIAIKHQVRKLMAEDQLKKAEVEVRAVPTDMPQLNVGPRRRTTQALQSIARQSTGALTASPQPTSGAEA